MKKKLLFLLVLPLLTFNILAVLNLNTIRVSAGEYPAIYIEPEITVDPALTPGNNYTISVKTDYTGADINCWQFTLNYDPNILHGGVNKMDTWIGDGVNTRFFTTRKPVVPNSEKVYVNQTRMEKPANYTIDCDKGEITLTLLITDTWIGDGVNTRFFTTRKPVVPYSDKVYLNETQLSRNVEYSINYDEGEITLKIVPDAGAEIKATYNVPPGLGAEIKTTYLYGGVTNGDLIHPDKDTSATFNLGTFNNTQGTLSLTAAFFFYIFPPAPLTSGPGTLANVTFTVVGYGVSDITLGPETKLIGITEEGYGNLYYIIDGQTMPNHIQHGTFLNIQPTHDVAVADLFVPDEAALGQLVSINVTVANEGTHDENVTLTVSYNSMPINTILVYMLPPGESETVKFSWDTSTGVVEGNYLINATATITKDDKLANNNKTKPIALKLTHDVAVTSLAAPERALVGQLVSINVTVTNQGSYNEIVTVGVYNETTVIETQIFDLTKGASTTRLFSWDTSAGIAEGSYTIESVAAIPQDDKPANNNKTKPIVLTFVRDMAVVSVARAPEMPIVGQLVSINVTVKNYGSYSEDFEVWFTCYVTIKRAQETVYTNERQSVTPPLGDSTTLSFNWNTTGITPGGHRIVAKVTLAEDVNTTNNHFTSEYFSVISSLGTIQGCVRDSLTEDPITGANVTVDTIASTTTDEGGKYSITNIPAGTHNVTASAEGYRSSSETITITAGETTILIFNLTLTPLPTTGTIAGTVKDSSTGDPIADAIVTVNSMSTTTNSSGAYVISDVPPGNYTVTASADGYKSSTRANITVVAGEMTPVNFELTPVQPLNILLYAGAAAVAIIIVATMAIYTLKVRKPRPPKR